MADAAALDKLKLKYQSVLDKIGQLQARLENLHLQDGKLFLRAKARTRADSNELWNQIKRVDAQYADLTADIGFDAEGATPASVPVVPRTYTVQRGDTLSDIAQRVYGKASEYQKIFAANREQLTDPDKINPGQVLKLP